MVFSDLIDIFANQGDAMEISRVLELSPLKVIFRKEMNKEQIIEHLRQTARAVLPADARLILFGSQARGDARKGSDWDLLVLLPQESRVTDEDFAHFVYPFIEFGYDIEEEINPLVYTNKEWNRRRITPFYKEVTSQGIDLCH